MSNCFQRNEIGGVFLHIKKRINAFLISNRHYISPIIIKVARLCWFKTTVDYKRARESLSVFSKKPKGHCFANNNCEVRYDLQIIIPAYNVEKYIETCLDSIARLSTNKYKVLVQIINDGSTDGTNNIIEEYLKNFNFEITVIQQKNKGLSETRNLALRTLYGRYIMFIDSDDYLPDNINLDLLLDNAVDCEILQGDWIIVDSENVEVHRRESDLLSGYAWGKIYSYTIFKKLHFPAEYWYEDTIIKFIISRLDVRIKNLHEYIYCYRVNPDGISSTASKRSKAIDSYWITELCLEDLPRFEIEYDEMTFNNLIQQAIINQIRIIRLPRRIRKYVFALTTELIEKYFQDMSSTKYIDVERALRNKQFIKFELLAMAYRLS